MTRELTERQSQILAFIYAFIQSHGYPPTVREIGDHFQMASSSSFEHLRALEKKGYIRRDPFKPRCMELLRKAA